MKHVNILPGDLLLSDGNGFQTNTDDHLSGKILGEGSRVKFM